MRHRSGKYTVCRLVRAAFSPEILQAGAVKGLIRTGGGGGMEGGEGYGGEYVNMVLNVHRNRKA